jgi:hypothetical protein
MYRVACGQSRVTANAVRTDNKQKILILNIIGPSSAKRDEYVLGCGTMHFLFQHTTKHKFKQLHTHRVCWPMVLRPPQFRRGHLKSILAVPCTAFDLDVRTHYVGVGVPVSA